jgi:hypothetical protein
LAIGGSFLQGNTILVDGATMKIWLNGDFITESFLAAFRGADRAYAPFGGIVKIWRVSWSYVAIEFPNYEIIVYLSFVQRMLGWLTLDLRMRQISGQYGVCGNFDPDGQTFTSLRVDPSQELLDNCD